MDIFILVGLITLNGIFAMSELALVAAKSSRLKKLAETQSSARLALELKNNPTRFLSTIQIGITAIGILSGIFGEATLSGPLAQWLIHNGLEPELASIVATASVVVIITYFAIVVGELVPKRFAQRNAERIAVIVAYPIHWLAMLTSPFVMLLSGSTDALLKLFRQHGNDNEQVTEEDIFAVVNEGSESGAIEPQEQEMIRNILYLNDRLVTSLMTPRCDIDYLDVELPIEQLLVLIRQTQHSVWPVCHGGLDNIIGTISSKVLLDQYEELSIEKVVRLARKPKYYPESMKGLPLLNQMQQNNGEMAFIVDEYGDIQGIVTHYDILESVAGELGQAPQHKWARQHQDGSWRMDALIPLNELKRRLALGALDGESIEGFQTLNGYLTWKAGKVPQKGEIIECEEWLFEILAATSSRIIEVKVWSKLV
ncbi:HlyC/CorC family transporter [Vibrio aquaticus]|uniref:HlyC/CorC family transporter n=1 Tax=Vibrio aquaticus TaxID=2496559 RepID=A0A3S0MI51_9VIBR|nr:hemolysin family protein [Vibrio aquaticus]RTZ15314.1 HlyC/CorC family transporter [Vibrio aquaticus]